MAISVTHLDAGVTTSDPGVTASVAATTGGVLILSVGMSLASGFPTDALTVTGLGATWTKVDTVTYVSRRRLWIYHGVGATGSGTISIDHANVFQEVAWVLAEATGVDTTTPTSDPAMWGDTNSVGTSATATSLGTAGTGDVTFSVLCLEQDTANGAIAGFVELGNTTSTGNSGVRRMEHAWDVDAALTGEWTWSGNSGSATGVVILNVAAGGAVTGTAAVTLGGASATVAGVPDVAGVAAVPLGGATVTVAGTPDVTGVAAVALGSLTVSVSAANAVAGTAAVALGAATVTVSGTPDVAGTAAVALGAATVTVSGTPDVAGAVTVALGAVTVTVAGTPDVAGTAAVSLGSLSVTVADGVIVLPARASISTTDRRVRVTSTATGFTVEVGDGTTIEL